MTHILQDIAINAARSLVNEQADFCSRGGGSSPSPEAISHPNRRLHEYTS